MFKPKAIYFEKDIVNYTLGKELIEKYKEVPKVEIENHNTKDLKVHSKFINKMVKVSSTFYFNMI